MSVATPVDMPLHSSYVSKQKGRFAKKESNQKGAKTNFQDWIFNDMPVLPQTSFSSGTRKSMRTGTLGEMGNQIAISGEVSHEERTGQISSICMSVLRDSFSQQTQSFSSLQQMSRETSCARSQHMTNCYRPSAAVSRKFSSAPQAELCQLSFVHTTQGIFCDSRKRQLPVGGLQEVSSSTIITEARKSCFTLSKEATGTSSSSLSGTTTSLFENTKRRKTKTSGGCTTSSTRKTRSV